MSLKEWQRQMFSELQGPLLSELQGQLQSACSQQLQIKINDNLSTMLSVRWEPSCTKVSLHHMFLEAPKNVIKALGRSIEKGQTVMAPQVKAFIQDSLNSLDDVGRMDSRRLSHKGDVYNLKKIYDALNAEYFNGDLDLNITWFGKSQQKNKSQVTFGLFNDVLKLIKIHRMMDSVAFPDYVLAFVIYHEMLHYVCPAYVDVAGVHRVHYEEFKEREKQFKEYQRAKKWIHEHRETFFD